MISFGNKKPKIPPAHLPAADDRWHPGIKAFGDNTAEARVGRHNALLFAWGCLILATVLAFGIISANHQPKLVPYVIRVDEHGQAADMGVPPRLDQDQSLETYAIQYQLRQFIQAVRTVTVDPDFQKKMMLDYVEPFTVPNTEATTLINDFYKTNDPFKIAQKNLTIDVAVDEPVPQSDKTFQLHWFETTKNDLGVVIKREEWTGFATVELHQVTPDQVRLNPMGIYITQLTWQSVTAGSATSAAPAASAAPGLTQGQ